MTVFFKFGHVVTEYIIMKSKNIVGTWMASFAI